MESHTVPNAAKHTGIQKRCAYKDDEQADVEKCFLPWLEHVDSKRNLVVEPHVRQPLPDLHGGRVGACGQKEREIQSAVRLELNVLKRQQHAERHRVLRG
jgi:hypothetical protein